MLRPGFVGMRGQWSDDYGMHDHEYTPPITGLLLGQLSVADEVPCIVIPVTYGDGIHTKLNT